MLVEEAKWLNRQLNDLRPNQIYPMCNLGSSTEHFRRVEQQYIDKLLFEQARLNNLPVIHVDAKAAPGVDIVGDLTDLSFPGRLAELSHVLQSLGTCN